jgi:hypothetical protein
VHDPKVVRSRSACGESCFAISLGVFRESAASPKIVRTQSTSLLGRPGWRRDSLSFFLTNRNDVVGNDPTFTGDDHPHRNAFRFVMVGTMQQVHDANSRAKT